jgi:hypothetical protein
MATCLPNANSFFSPEPRTKAQDKPAAPPPIIKVSNIYFSFVLVSIFLLTRKICSNRSAHKEAKIVIKATVLCPLKGALKLISVTL